MATYKEIKGVTVQTKDTDPNLAGAAGATFASGGNLPTALSSLRGLGPQTAAVAVGGTTAPGPANSATFHYDGSSWSTPPATLNTARGLANISKLGTQTAGIYFGGSPYAANNESYNGSVWTEVNDLNTARQELGGSGTQAAALATGGRISSPAYVANNESWNGSSWTEVNDLNTARGSLDSTGTSTDSIAAGGTIAPASPVVGANSETWDGTSWTTTTSFSTARRGNSMFGLTSTDALVTGGDTSGNPFPGQSLTGSTEYWNGSSWTELADLATGRSAAGSSGSSTAGLVEGGYGPPSSVLTATEEWTQSSSPVLVEGMLFLSEGTTLKGFGRAAGIPTATWASGGSLNDGRSSLTGIGIQTAVVAVSGQDSTTSLIASVEEYNGSVWTEVNNTPVTLKYPGAGGILTAGWVAGGLTTYNGTAFNAETFEYDGTNWTDSGNINTNRYTAYGGGPQTAAFIAGGNNTSFAAVGNTELYNGSAWSETTDLNTARNNAFGNGTQTDGIYAGGSPGNKADTELWNGTTWTEVNNLNTARHSIGVGGGIAPGSSVLVAGGTDGTNNEANVETWNGTSWTEQANLAATNSSNGLGISSAVSAINFGGFAPSPSTFATVTEEWTADNILSNVTVS